jgi:hypothetical protein
MQLETVLSFPFGCNQFVSIASEAALAAVEVVIVAISSTAWTQGGP